MFLKRRPAGHICQGSGVGAKKSTADSKEQSAGLCKESNVSLWETWRNSHEHPEICRGIQSLAILAEAPWKKLDVDFT